MAMIAEYIMLSSDYSAQMLAGRMLFAVRIAAASFEACTHSFAKDWEGDINQEKNEEIADNATPNDITIGVAHDIAYIYIYIYFFFFIPPALWLVWLWQLCRKPFPENSLRHALYKRPSTTLTWYLTQLPREFGT